jgi:hypothetical protein
MAELDSINDLSLDDENLNAGSERGQAIIEESIRRLGAGRSIVVDKNGKTIAGNNVLQKAVELGLEAEFVHTNGSRLVVVVRDDLDLDNDTRARELSIADNRASEVGLNWRANLLNEMRVAKAGLKLDYMFTTVELQKLGERMQKKLQRNERTVTCPNCKQEFTP